MLVSPAEPVALRALGQTSSVPERYGADFLFASKLGLVGVQRKEIKDLANSQADGRIRKEVEQQKSLAQAVWMIEGEWRWTPDGESLAVSGYTKNRLLSLTFSLQSKGCWILQTTSLTDSIVSLSTLESWLTRENHSSIGRRPNPGGSWGKATSRDWCLHVLESFEGIGAKQAAAIYDHFNGLPLRWNCTLEELLKVKGIGVKRATALIEAIGYEGEENGTV